MTSQSNMRNMRNPSTTLRMSLFVMILPCLVLLYSTNMDSIIQRIVINAWMIPTTPQLVLPASSLYSKRHIIRSKVFSIQNADSDGSGDTVLATQLPGTTDISNSKETLEQRMAQLKRVLEREYITFFNPMECDYYSPDVTFIDPLTTLVGINGYEQNVNMLSGRTLFGSILFRDARILLHSITGGNIVTPQNNEKQLLISNIITRWTLRFTFQILPWNPSPCFTGISNYTVQVCPNSKYGIQIVQQRDYWDSINLFPGGIYDTVSKPTAIQHFVSLLLPSSKLQANAAGPELPYTILRIAKDYEVRKYPSYVGIQMKYERRDEAFITLGSYTDGLTPMAPAIIQVDSSQPNNVIKTMTWPIYFMQPGIDDSNKESTLVNEKQRIQNQLKGESDTDITTMIVPERIVAVRTFNDMIVEPLVRKVDVLLRGSLSRDGLLLDQNDDANNDAIGGDVHMKSSILTFAQYDAIYSMGERRCEVHIPLKEKQENGDKIVQLPW